MTSEERVRAILELSRFTGSEITSDFIRRTSDHFPAAGISRIHNLIEGIYKPANDRYALCIWSRSAAGAVKEIYKDLLKFKADGTWVMEYAAKRGDLKSDINRSLFASMRDRVPILVIVTSRPSRPPIKARYKLLGAAIIENFDLSSRRFSLRGCSPLIESQFSKQSNPLNATILQMRNRLIMPFQLHEDRAAYQSEQTVRDLAFRRIILNEYRCQCSVCQSKFFLKQGGKEPLVEAEAAHIISIKAKGPDDPRNGLSLCKRHHWAFDEGLFTITDGHTIKVSPSVLKAKKRRFDLEEYEGEAIVSPANEICRPDDEALHWHQKRKFRRA